MENNSEDAELEYCDKIRLMAYEILSKSENLEEAKAILSTTTLLRIIEFFSSLVDFLSSEEPELQPEMQSQQKDLLFELHSIICIGNDCIEAILEILNNIESQKPQKRT